MCGIERPNHKGIQVRGHTRGIRLDRWVLVPGNVHGGGAHTVCLRGVTLGAFVTVSVKYLFNLVVCILASPALFIGAFCSDPPCVNSAHVNPRLWGLSEGTKARGLSPEPVALPVGGGGVTSTKTTLISNTCLCVPRTPVGVTVAAVAVENPAGTRSLTVRNQ